MSQLTGSLDFTKQDLETYLETAAKMVVESYQNTEDKNAYGGLSPKVVRGAFDEPLPELPTIFDTVLEHVQTNVLDPSTKNIGPYMYAYVMSGGNHVSIIGDLLASAINQNVGKWHLAPAMSELEARIVYWTCQFINISPRKGTLVSGGSAANQMGLTIARNIFFENEQIRRKGLFGMPRMRVYASTEVHSCIDKSIDMLGIGMDNLVKIPVTTDFKINLELLEKAIKDDISKGFKPFCIVGTAGTVNTGAIDDLEGLASLAKKYSLWFHVDGAYGGLAKSLASQEEQYKGLDQADTIALDFHKWLYQQFEVGCCLAKDWDTLSRTFAKKATYLSSDTDNDGRLDFNLHAFQLSRNAKALKIYMSYKTFGSQKIKAAIQNDVDNTIYLAQKINENPHLELVSGPTLGIACFRYVRKHTDQKTIDTLNKEIIPALEKDARIFITGTIIHDRPVIRACLINHRHQHKHLDYMLNVIVEVGSAL